MSRGKTAQDFDSKPRTDDVVASEATDFASLLLSPKILEGLRKSGFLRPSPIQLKAIPLGRCGLDMVVQAKSGTGKTCVFAVIALEGLSLAEVAGKSRGSLTSLVVAPTREIAWQVRDVITDIGSAMDGLKVHAFIGGLPVKDDLAKLSNCHIAVGTPGRLKQLIDSGGLNTDSIRLFVLDEADKLFEHSFTDDINWIYSRLPENKQVLALSATYPEYVANALQVYMRNPTFARLDARQPALLGIRQFFEVLPPQSSQGLQLQAKTEALLRLLSSVSFNQCLVFSNLQSRAQHLATLLSSKGWPASHIAGSQEQQSRLFAMSRMKAMQIRILVSTDLTARGVDVEHVDLIVNLDVPFEAETYLHRIGRAGRFGSYGVAVTLPMAGQEEQNLLSIMSEYQLPLLPLPKDPESGAPPHDLISNSQYWNRADLDAQQEKLELGLVCNGFTTTRLRKKPSRPKTKPRGGEGEQGDKVRWEGGKGHAHADKSHKTANKENVRPHSNQSLKENGFHENGFDESYDNKSKIYNSSGQDFRHPSHSLDAHPGHSVGRPMWQQPPKREEPLRLPLIRDRSTVSQERPQRHLTRDEARADREKFLAERRDVSDEGMAARIRDAAKNCVQIGRSRFDCTDEELDMAKKRIEDFFSGKPEQLHSPKGSKNWFSGSAGETNGRRSWSRSRDRCGEDESIRVDDTNHADTGNVVPPTRNLRSEKAALRSGREGTYVNFVVREDDGGVSYQSPNHNQAVDGKGRNHNDYRDSKNTESHRESYRESEAADSVVSDSDETGSDVTDSDVTDSDASDFSDSDVTDSDESSIQNSEVENNLASPSSWGLPPHQMMNPNAYQTPHCYSAFPACSMQPWPYAAPQFMTFNPFQMPIDPQQRSLMSFQAEIVRQQSLIQNLSRLHKSLKPIRNGRKKF